MRTKPALVAVALASLAAAPGAALATPGFPAGIQNHLALDYQPPCTVCHLGTAKSGTATQPFAVALKDHGLVAGDDASLATALDALAAASPIIDSDGDGTGDIDQLKAGCDPNADTALKSGATCGGGSGTGGAADTAPTAAYGCGNSGAQIAAGPVGPGSAFAGLAAALGLVLARRRSRRTA